MTRLRLFSIIAAALAVAAAASPARAQDEDTLRISGSFRGYGGVTNIGGVEYPGNCGQDLAAVHANNEWHGWTLTLHGVTRAYDYYYYEWEDEFGLSYEQQLITRVHATSFDIEFVGPEAEVLNEVVSAQLAMGSLAGGAVLELINGDYYYAAWGENGTYSYWNLGLAPGPEPGVSFFVNGEFLYFEPLPTDEFGFPAVEPQRLYAYSSTISDNRSGNSGGLASYSDLVDIGSNEPPYLPPIPPPPPTMNIDDASTLEGDRGNKTLLLTVRISRISEDPVSVDFRTVNGSATTKKDYLAASGTVIFLPGETERMIAVTIKGDRQREPNETFTVQLYNAVGATINDSLATATIVNDD